MFRGLSGLARYYSSARIYSEAKIQAQANPTRKPPQDKGRTELILTENGYAVVPETEATVAEVIKSQRPPTKVMLIAKVPMRIEFKKSDR
jgi:hypothetical protein